MLVFRRARMSKCCGFMDSSFYLRWRARDLRSSIKATIQIVCPRLSTVPARRPNLGSAFRGIQSTPVCSCYPKFHSFSPALKNRYLTKWSSYHKGRVEFVRSEKYRGYPPTWGRELESTARIGRQIYSPNRRSLSNA
jgi:hypothetical protein